MVILKKLLNITFRTTVPQLEGKFALTEPQIPVNITLVFIAN